MIGFIDLCAIRFLAQEPIPQELEVIYQQTYRCKNFKPLQKTLAKDKLENINRYFPSQKRVWPLLLNPLEEGSLQEVRLWLEKGVKPGFLLPQGRSFNYESFEKIRNLSKIGAIPIAGLKKVSNQDMEVMRYYWCMHGSCPAGWFLESGVDQNLKALPPSLYLGTKYWKNNINLPTPDRVFKVGDKKIVPWNQIQTVRLGEEKKQQEFSSYFTPLHNEKWQWLGVDFHYKDSGIETNIFGNIILLVGEMSFIIWDKIHPLNINIFSIINQNFSWIAVFIAGLNIFLMIKSIMKKRKG